MLNVRKVAVQTNLSCSLDWLRSANRDKVALWSTFHPEEISLAGFLNQCQILDQIDVKYSVGIVGLKDNVNAAEELRSRLSPEVYMWVNAYKREPDYYDEELFERFEKIDPLFSVNSIRHPSLGKPCHTGQSVVSIDGEGNARRCHFVDQVLGNIYSDAIESILKPRVCPNKTCGCHIGYVHMPDLDLYTVFDQGLLERIPAIQLHSLNRPRIKSKTPVG